LSPLAEPNISATVFALEALRAAGVESSASQIQKARRFVERCQNFAPEGIEPTAFDDGGFFFLQTDQFRNKAGIAGHDKQGRERYASYGSATADGLRALLLCGEQDNSPRVQAGFNWLADHFSAEHQPGTFAAAAARDSVYFYYTRSLARLLDVFQDAVESHSIDRRQWAQQLAAELIARQRQDGSWVNADVEVREDDPIVATSMATAALAACQRILESAGGE
jgi:squalene-hopene/tetraprenyl-beta-curcumene cyclase